LSGELVEAGRNLLDGSSAIVFNKVKEFLNERFSISSGSGFNKQWHYLLLFMPIG
jgi:hypothetical protein